MPRGTKAAEDAIHKHASRDPSSESGRAKQPEAREWKVSESFWFLLCAAIVLALSVPYFITSREAAYRHNARADARTLTAEIESVLRELGDWTAEPVTITWDPNTQILSIPNPGGNPPIIHRKLPLTAGTRLYMPEEPQNLANVISNKRDYCVAVISGSQIAYQSQNGPVPDCT